MPRHVGKSIFFLVFAWVVFSHNIYSRTEITFNGNKVPQNFYVGSHFIFYQSDSLFVNQKLLERDVDYSFDTRRGAFNLSHLKLTQNDTLTIIYSGLPSWVKVSYGHSLPEIEPIAQEPQPILWRNNLVSNTINENNINISGAKTFRFNSQTSGASRFSQSLDLKLSGNLTPGLKLSGAVSDRGYNPSYGTANSRLNELDKINLNLSSQNFTAQIGDIILRQNSRYGSDNNKRVSGAEIKGFGDNWHVDAVAARPRGRFQTYRFYGVDNKQGPYQIIGGAQTLPIVPGSETVWLDGKKLERGANKDYLMEYPIGRITFNVNHPIDNRSRIEIDYEQQTTNYREEYLTSDGGYIWKDSLLAIDVGWIREGDDKNQLQTGDFTESDKNLLSSIGDQTTLAMRSGVRQDSLGSYSLNVDSLPDSVFQYVENEKGDYSLTFSYLGVGKGDYQFLGGNQYRFVGHNKGEYLPVVILPVPERSDYYRSKVTFKNTFMGKISADFQQSNYDKNLFSSLDDNDNSGIYYMISSEKNWTLNGRLNNITVKSRRKEADFKTRERLYRADFSRYYFLPTNYQPSTDETINEIRTSLAPLSKVIITPFYSYLDYKNSFTSKTGGFGITLSSVKKNHISSIWKSTRTKKDSLSIGKKGIADNITTDVAYNINSSLKFAVNYEYDNRKNNYYDKQQGTRYHQIQSTLSNQYGTVGYEYYNEDTLTGTWMQHFQRQRITVESSRKWETITYNTIFSYQWLKHPHLKENSFLSRINFQYDNMRKKLNWGTSYVLSQETRNSQGISYLQVASGEGNYIFEDSNYIPDPNGNYIKVEEILSAQAKVKRGEKSFHFNKTWSKLLVRFHSNIEEELLPHGTRKLWWAIPFYSDKNQPYLFYHRRYDSDIRIIPLAFGHAISFIYNEDLEKRQINGSELNRRDYNGKVIFREALNNSYWEQSGELFKDERDSYYSGGGNIKGYKTTLKYHQMLTANDISGSVSYRHATSDNSELSNIYAFTFNSRVQLINKGEWRSSLEIYHQTLRNIQGISSYLLTDNHGGRKGAIWSMSLRYGLKSGMKINFYLTGQHADNRVARLTGRGEFIAEF